MVREMSSRRIVERLRERARAAEQAWTPSQDEPAPLHPVRNHPALRYLHDNWALRQTMEPPSLRATKARPRGALKALFRRWLYSAMLRYLEDEQELIANMVRLQDALAKRCDALWEEQTETLAALRADMLDLAAHVETLVERRGLEREVESG